MGIADDMAELLRDLQWSGTDSLMGGQECPDCSADKPWKPGQPGEHKVDCRILRMLMRYDGGER